MPIQLMRNKPRLSFGFVCIFGIAVGIVVTQVQANIEERVEIDKNNPHHIPDDLNPKLRRIEGKVELLGKRALVHTSDAVESLEENVETVHSLVFKESTSYTKPIYDYTTGTSN